MKRAIAIRWAGDADMGRALAEGMAAVTPPADPAQIEAGRDALRAVDLARGRERRYWAAMIRRADRRYGHIRPLPGILAAALGLYALAVYLVTEAFDVLWEAMTK